MIGAGKVDKTSTRLVGVMRAEAEKARKLEEKVQKDAKQIANKDLEKFKKKADFSKLNFTSSRSRLTPNLHGDSGALKITGGALADKKRAALENFGASLCGPVDAVKVQKFIAMMKSNLTTEEKALVVAAVIDGGSSLHSNRDVLEVLSRDERLALNQIIRQANGLVAYKHVQDLDVTDHKAFFAAFDRLPAHEQEIINDNATFALLENAKKLNIDGAEELEMA